MILSSTEAERRKALNELSKYVKRDIKATLAVMSGRPVTIRLIDPPLHEFVPQEASMQKELAKALGISASEVKKRGDALHEINPMMGHRGVRLGVTYPEITEMQVRAILEAAAELKKERKKPLPEIMIPVTSHVNEFKHQKEIVDRVYKEVLAKTRVKKIDYMVGTMIEIPRAALTAGELARDAEFFSFGTNDLTQMTFGYSRDDAVVFLGEYVDKKILPEEPFQILDQTGVGELMDLAVQRGKKTRPKIKLGICGEHGGESKSVKFCHKIGLNYVSCSPFRVPIARLAAAQAVIEEKAAAKAKKK
jgi:pyruvate,orthophosphate dikinase